MALFLRLRPPLAVVTPQSGVQQCLDAGQHLDWRWGEFLDPPEGLLDLTLEQCSLEGAAWEHMAPQLTALTRLHIGEGCMLPTDALAMAAVSTSCILDDFSFVCWSTLQA